MQSVFIFLGRIFISLIFIFAALGSIFNWDSMHQELVGRLCDWVSFTATMPSIQKFIDFLLPLTPMLQIISTIFMALGGIMVFLGIKPRMGALLLILYLLPTTVVMHAFWLSATADQTLQLVMFMKNLAILGGLFILLGCGGAKAKSAA